MLKKTSRGYYTLPALAQYPHLFHAISGRHFGNLGYDQDFTQNNRIVKFLEVLGKKEADLVVPEQVHGSRLKVVTHADRGRVISGVDGLVTGQKGLLLGVKSADCLPLMFYDPVEQLVGAIHAGWRGVYRRIPAKTVDLFIKLGSLPENIIIGVGPAIGGCCYDVNQSRAENFVARFGTIPGMVVRKEGKYYLDLLAVVVRQLTESGIDSSNIYTSGACTACQTDKLYSYRREKPADRGNMLSVMSLY